MFTIGKVPLQWPSLLAVRYLVVFHYNNDDGGYDQITETIYALSKQRIMNKIRKQYSKWGKTIYFNKIVKMPINKYNDQNPIKSEEIRSARTIKR